MIIAQGDVETLTGCVRPSAQARWLRKHGWRFVINSKGRPIVALAEFNRHTVGGGREKSAQDPDFSQINSPIKGAGKSGVRV
jgi:hypothetical protein